MSLNILFLCTGNSARSIVGEALFNAEFSKHGKAYSAGSRPTGKINDGAIKVLTDHGHSIDGTSSQNCMEYAEENAPEIHIVISVCDNAANDCAIWPGKGKPKRLHWPLPDPADIKDPKEKAQAFENTYASLKEKLTALVSSPEFKI